MTTTDGTHAGTNAVSDAATFSYTLTAIATLTAAGSYSTGDYLAGKYADGSYALTSFVHDEQATDSLTFTTAAIGVNRISPVVGQPSHAPSGRHSDIGHFIAQLPIRCAQ